MTKSRHVPRDVWTENIKKGIAARSEEEKQEWRKKISAKRAGRTWGSHTEEWKQELSKRYTGIKRGSYNREVLTSDRQREFAKLREEYTKLKLPNMPSHHKYNYEQLKRLVEMLKKVPD